ncbi:YibE/F family protein [Anaerosporobacter sp.]|uniref:YibE/F family protein n=1 Tax=Anaerosporobacter sp. TaxID=1872529 RepID=UPI00286FA1D3|nr:YibE/F family protein [Anaerosporobacter sp.]
MKIEICKKNFIRNGCLAVAGILFLLFLYNLNQIEKESFYDTEGRNFVKAKVVEIIEDNETEGGNYIGSQTVMISILSGEFKGELLEANSSSSFLYGTHCEVGKKVIAIVSESNGTFVASIYSVDRAAMIYLIIGIFMLTIILIGGKKGLASVVGLGFTIICILFLFLPLIYRGVSPILAAVVVTLITTCVTMYLIGGWSVKTFASTTGTVIGVIIAGVCAILFSKMTQITGYNVSDIEDLIYVGEKTSIQIGQLMFAGILIAALGAVMDVAMSIASTILEINEKNQTLTRKELFRSGMNVGKDMMGTMSNTLILAFTGGSINTLVFIYAYNYQYNQVMNLHSIGIEIIQGIASSMGVILTVPCVSLITCMLVKRKEMHREVQK